MKPIKSFMVGSAICASLFSEVPKFHAPTLIKDGSQPIHLEVGYAAPTVTDWDGDGNKDLLVGQFKSAKIRFYRNLSSDANPMFEGFSYLQAGGEDIHLTAG